MNALRLSLALGNTLVAGVLLLIPIVKLFGLVEVAVPPSAVFGWFLVFLPTATALPALIGVRFSIPTLKKPCLVQTAVALSFLLGILSVMAAWSMYQEDRFDLFPITVATALLVWLNVWALGQTALLQIQEASRSHPAQKD